MYIIIKCKLLYWFENSEELLCGDGVNRPNTAP